MYNKIRKLAVLTACFVGFTAAAHAQVSGIEGMVKDPEGKPIQGAVIKIERKDIKGNYTVKSDKKGHYGHYGLPLGTYKLTLEVDGKTVDQVDNVRTRLGDPLNIPFNMRPAQPQQSAQGGPGAGAAPQAPPPEKDRTMSKEQRDALEKQNKEREAQIAKNKALNDAFQAGKAAVEQKNYDAAIENFKKASEMEGGNQSVIWANLADAMSTLQRPSRRKPRTCARRASRLIRKRSN